MYIILGRVFWLILRPVVLLALRKSQRCYVLIQVRGSSEVLVVKNWLGNGEWRLPGGGRKRGETPATAAVREIAEETGINIKEGQLKKLLAKPPGLISHGWVAYAVNLHTKPTVSRRRLEIVADSWQTKEDLLSEPNQILSESLRSQ